MPIWTDLHAALGEKPGPLTFDMISEACEDAVEETGALDWKRDLPLPDGLDKEQHEAKLADLVGDLAAMANSGGGLLVYGVEQTRGQGRSTAKEIVPVGPVTDTVARGIRRAAASGISPRLVDLEVIHLVPDGAPEAGVVAVWVEPSIDAPHLVVWRKQQDYFFAPYRNGPDTERMTERQLEAAYRDRLLGREARRRTLNDLFVELAEDLPRSTEYGSAWVVLVAAPVIEGPARRLDRDALAGTIGALAHERDRRVPGDWGPLIEIAIARPWPKPGLRSWVWSSRRAEAAVQLQIGSNGVLTLAFSRLNRQNEAGKEAPHPVVLEDALSCLTDLEVLLPALAEAGVTRGDYNVMLGVAPASARYVRTDPTFFDSSRLVAVDHAGPLRPMTAYVPFTAGGEAVSEALEQLARDAFNQVGLEPPHRP